MQQQAVIVSGISNREFLERYAQPGRVGLYGGTTPVDTAIRSAQQLLRPNGQWSDWSHVFLFEGQRVDGHHWVLESDVQILQKNIQLGAQDRFGWAEPDGKVYQIASDNLGRLKDEIYRVSFLMQQAGDSGGSMQSGLSKQWDFAVTQEILSAYGDVVKDAMRNIMNGVAAARQDALTVDVTGLDSFDITDFSTEATDAQSLLNLGIESPTLKKQVYKRVALKYLCDARQEIKDRIAEEIDAA